MSEIQVLKKPDNITFKEIQEVIKASHEENIKKGIVMKAAALSAREMEERVGKEGTCFVAMDDDKVVGTLSCSAKEIHYWYHDGKTLKVLLAGILPAYQGRGIMSMFLKAAEDEAKKYGIDTLFLDTAEENINMRQLCVKKGFRHVDFRAFHSNHYSVILMKWMKGCLMSEKYCAFRFRIKRIYTIFRYKKGGSKRFYI